MLELAQTFQNSEQLARVIKCLELRAAERLIGRALAGNPPQDIADELRDLLLTEIYAHRQAIGQ